ncbi:MAG: hypothetical protein JW952_06755, partial [Candidatus Eisenbacteria bacterium]|nr:hypothetical protein [Candidatus Eisenbacteria bacterium]
MSPRTKAAARSRRAASVRPVAPGVGSAPGRGFTGSSRGLAGSSQSPTGGEQRLAGKKILLGVTGSIAAYKAVDLLRELTKRGARVTVCMTAAAREFVTPLTFETLSGERVLVDMFGPAA